MKKMLSIAALAIALIGAVMPAPASAHPTAICAAPVASGPVGAAPFPIFFPFVQVAIVTAPWWINSTVLQDAAHAVGLNTYNDEGYPTGKGGV